jgi:hypothetical protein
MNDTNEITQLLYRLYERLDGHDFDGMGELFTDDATGRTPGGLAEGRTALVAQARRNHDGVPRLQHRVSNVIVELEDDVARIRAVVDGAFADDAGTRRYEIGEVYEAGVRRVADGWKLTGFEMRPVWQSGTRPIDGRFPAPE